MQRSRLEDEAEEKQRNQDEGKAQKMRRCTQVDEDAGMRRSSQGDEAKKKQQSSDKEDPEEMQSRGDQDEAVHKQPRAEGGKECPGLDHPGQNKKERPKRNDHKKRRKESRRPGQEQPWRNKEQGPPPPGQGHLGTSGCQMPRMGASGTEQGARASAALEHPETSGGRTPRTESSGVDQAARAAAPPTGWTEDKGRPDAPDWNIRGGTGSRSHRTHDTKVEGHVVGRQPGPKHLGQNKKGRPQPPGPGKEGLPPRAGMPGADQPEGVPTPRAGASRGNRRPEAKETGGREQGGAAKETRPQATQRTRPRKCRKAEKWTRLRGCRAATMRTGPWCSSETELWMRPMDAEKRP